MTPLVINEFKIKKKKEEDEQWKVKFDQQAGMKAGITSLAVTHVTASLPSQHNGNINFA